MSKNVKFRKIKINQSKIDFWVKSKQNVLMIGKHGVGKTSIIRQAFERYGLVLDETFKMFSGATLDPWTDFVGVPKRAIDENGEEFLDYIRPKHMNGDLRAIFMDEFNRAKPKVRNALMELVQFKSINGQKFPNLEFVWAAINPEDDDVLRYDVEELDPAQRDRFQVIVEIPYEPDKPFFTNKYGKHRATQTIQWWHAQDKDTQDAVSPRRLEYVLDYSVIGGDIADILPVTANISQLKDMLKQNPIEAEFDEAFNANDTATLKTIINNENHWNLLSKKVVGDKKYWNLIGNHLKEERVALILRENSEFFNWACDNIASQFRVKNILESIFDSIETEKFDTESKTRLNNIFSYKKDIEDKFLAKNVNAKLMDKTTVPGYEEKDDVEWFNDKMDEYITLASGNLVKNQEKFFPIYYEKLCNTIIKPELLDLNLANKTLSWLNGMSVPFQKNEEFLNTYPGIVCIVNSVLKWLVDNGEFNKNSYFYELRHFRNALKFCGKSDELYVLELDTLTANDIAL